MVDGGDVVPPGDAVFMLIGETGAVANRLADP